ncbi:MAG: lysophospholipid acyltransferase family protein [Desulfatibacillaceae bacterium]|nr:lysophospholipid acyltransferase family protein [Desulfatibacillaceae bacterium]
MISKTEITDLAQSIKSFDPDCLENRSPFLIDLLIPKIGWALKKYFRASVEGIERIPKGPALYVGNHSMGMQTLDTGIFFAEAYNAHGMDALPYGLQHDIGLVLPVVSRLAAAAGGVRATRENGLTLLARGHKVITYPGGGEDAFRPFRHRNKIVFCQRTGYIRLALEAGVPIVPVVSAGAQAAFFIVDDLRWLAKALGLDKKFRIGVWPLMVSFPLGITFFPNPFFIPFPTKICMEVMEPIKFERKGKAAAKDDSFVRSCASRVEGAMQETLTRLAQKRRQGICKNQ